MSCYSEEDNDIFENIVGILAPELRQWRSPKFPSISKFQTKGTKLEPTNETLNEHAFKIFEARSLKIAHMPIKKEIIFIPTPVEVKKDAFVLFNPKNDK